MYRRELASVKSARFDLILLGDSLAELWNTEMWEPKHTLNLGVGGDDTQRVLWRLASPKLAKLRPRRVLIISAQEYLGFAKACAITEGLKRVIKRTSRLWPTAKITLLEITPKGEKFTRMNGDRVQVNAALRKIGGIKTINVDDIITCNWTEPCEYYREDKLHFTEAGYLAILPAVKRVIFGPSTN